MMINERQKIRSVPRYMSKRRQLGANFNKSMVNNRIDQSSNRGVILAMSRRTKHKG